MINANRTITIRSTNANAPTIINTIVIVLILDPGVVLLPFASLSVKLFLCVVVSSIGGCVPSVVVSISLTGGRPSVLEELPMSVSLNIGSIGTASGLEVSIGGEVEEEVVDGVVEVVVEVVISGAKGEDVGVDTVVESFWEAIDAGIPEDSDEVIVIEFVASVL